MLVIQDMPTFDGHISLVRKLKFSVVIHPNSIILFTHNDQNWHFNLFCFWPKMFAESARLANEKVAKMESLATTLKLLWINWLTGPI